jgi:hypothetical protein
MKDAIRINEVVKVMAHAAYALADAMLLERERKEST